MTEQTIELFTRKIRFGAHIVRRLFSPPRLAALAAPLRDILVSGSIPRDINIFKAELSMSHRVLSRQFLLNYIPGNSVGAELGVFTGLFSSLLAKEKKIKNVTFVDPWWEAFGDNYPEWWGAYTDYGRVKTHNAYELAKRRIFRAGLPGRVVVVSTSSDWLNAQPDESLDWVYIDSTHTYEGTLEELQLLSRKLKDTGLILGDDWREDPNDINHGVFLAVNEFLKKNDFEIVMCGWGGQYILRRSLPLSTARANLDRLIAESKNSISSAGPKHQTALELVLSRAGGY
jgi:Methyltransferase domain